MPEQRPTWATAPTRRLRLLRTIHGDWPIGHRNVASAGVYGTDEIYLNPHGAVAVLGVGGWLGVKPDEMVWLDEMPSCQPEPDIHG
jgi:hypothetical protein